MPDADATLVDHFDLGDFTRGLVQDLRDLRSGKITVRDARARADLAKQVLRSVHYVIQGRKAIEGAAKPVNAEPKRLQSRRGRRDA